jgi:negative regulator of sigma E activity
MVIKGELGVIQSALKQEIEINEENTLRLETTKRALMKVSDEITYNQHKEDQLTAHLRERRQQLAQREDQLLELDGKEREKVAKND